MYKAWNLSFTLQVLPIPRYYEFGTLEQRVDPSSVKVRLEGYDRESVFGGVHRSSADPFIAPLLPPLSAINNSKHFPQIRGSGAPSESFFYDD